MTGFFDFTQAIVRKPGHSVISGLRDGDGPDPDYERLNIEHDNYVAASAAASGVVVLAEPGFLLSRALNIILRIMLSSHKPGDQ